MRKARVAWRLFVTCVAISLAVGVSTELARATDLACGQIVTRSVKLETDLWCPESGLVIGADDVTIDLGGHTLTGPTSLPPNPSSAGVKTQQGLGLKNLRVMNGNIVGFNRGIAIRTAGEVEIRSVNIRSPVSAGIHVVQSTAVTISTVSIVGAAAPDLQPSGIYLNKAADTRIRSVLVRGFPVGVNFQCTMCLPGERPNSGDVKDSAFGEGGPFAVVVNYAENLTIAGNHVWGFWTADGGGGGIGGGFSGPVSALRIVDNTVTFSNRGVVFDGLTNSRIAGNILLNNQWGGVVLGFGCTGNRITSNIALDNGAGADLFHREDSSPNVWTENLCRTTYGADARCEPQAP